MERRKDIGSSRDVCGGGGRSGTRGDMLCSVVFRYNSLTSQDPSSLDILSPFGMTAMTLE